MSYYALFQGMAASKPTSWLSEYFHLLNHLAYNLGPYLAFRAVSLLTTDLITRSLTAHHLLYRYSEFDKIWYPVSGPSSNQCSTSDKIRCTLCLNAFRGEPASSWLDWHFTPNHNSSADFSTSVGSHLHVVSPTLHSGHG